MGNLVKFPSPMQRVYAQYADARSECANALGATIAAYGGTWSLGQTFNCLVGSAAIHNEAKPIAIAGICAISGFLAWRGFAPLITQPVKISQTSDRHAVIEFRRA